MRVLQTLKYYDPCHGGTESVVKNIVEGISLSNSAANFTVYSNNHFSNFKKINLKHDRLNIIKEPTPFFLRSQPLNFRYKNLKKLILEHDVIHHHYPFPNLELSLLRNLDLLKGKKLVITWHANIKNSRWSWIEKFYNRLIEKLLERADYIVVTSPQLLEASEILKKYLSKIKIIPLSFDPKYFTRESKIYPENRCFELLFVGKLRKYKGVEYLIKAIQTLNVKLTIVGIGEEMENLKELVKLLNIPGKVNFIIDASDENLSDIYLSSDLFILPSINEAEAFGVVQLEAMANGLPVINTKLDSGVPFVSLNNYTGITVEPRNSESIKLSIEKIVKDKKLYESFSFNALERSKLFTRKKMSEAYLGIYES
jgi:rhamnosyl/mannosyltransferase